MRYADSYHCPKTFDEYRERVTSAACLPSGKAREILREHAVPGRSKLDSYEVVDFVREHFPERYGQEVEKVVKYPRWLLAHGLELGYDELSDSFALSEPRAYTGRGGCRMLYFTASVAKEHA